MQEIPFSSILCILKIEQNIQFQVDYRLIYVFFS